MSKFLPIFVGIFLNLLPIFMASYCGESAIPFSFEVLPNGNPILGCARPNCFGWNAFGQPIRANDSNFYRVNKQPDGFFRKALTANMPKPFSEKDAAFYQPQNATCFAGFKRGRCSSSGGHWVGGIAPNWEGNDDNSLLLRCCHWKGMTQSIDRGMATVQNGQIVYGGEVLQGERQYAFDYISDIFRVNNGDKQKSFQYEVAIYRMACLPRPERLTANVEPSVLKEMVHKFALSAQNDLAKTSKTVEKPNSLGGEKSTKQLHKGESRVIKTSKWTASPVDNEGEEEEEKNGKQLVDNIHLGDTKRNKAFAAPNSPIQGPFMENELNGQKGEINDYEEEEIDPNKNVEYSSQTQQNGGQFGQNEPSIHYGEQQNQFNYNNNNNNYGTANIDTESANVNEPQMVMKKRIICDRNVTRSRSRAIRQACEATEVEVPEGSQAQISRGNSYYDPGQTQTQYQQSSWYYYYPSAGARQCFTGDTRVQIGGGGGKMRRMDELRVGDWVLSTNQSHIVYTIVESWIHRVPKQWANFVRIELEDGRVLKLTEKHFLYKRSNCGNEFEADGPIPIEKIHGEGEMVYAKEVKAGDCLFGHGKNSDFALIFEQKVAKVGIVREHGIYAPMTGTGDIFVEGILASCYSIESSPVLQKTIFNSWKSSPKIIENLFGHFDGDEINLPGWLHFMVEHLMPIVLPK